MKFIVSSVRNKLLAITGAGTALLSIGAAVGLFLFWSSAHRMESLLTHDAAYEATLRQLQVMATAGAEQNSTLQTVSDRLHVLASESADTPSADVIKKVSAQADEVLHAVPNSPNRAGEVGRAVGQAADTIAQRIAASSATEGKALTRNALVTAALMAVVVVLAFLVFTVFVRRGLLAPTAALVEDLKRLSTCDFSKPVRVLSCDELGQVASCAALVQDHIGTLVKQVRDSVARLNASAGGMQQVVERTLAATASQQSESEMVATAMEEMAASVQNVAQNTSAAATATREATTEAENSQTVVRSAIAAIETLATSVERNAAVIRTVDEDSVKIGGVLDVIKGIADQTNLLALNAAIEAARAGEQGRGFAVVADEVRTLAQRTQVSASEIQAMITRLQQSTTEAVNAMDRSREVAAKGVEQANHVHTSLDVITGSVRTIDGMNTQIAFASDEQTKVADEISRNIVHVRDVTLTTVDGARETAQATEELVGLAADLDTLVSKFHL